MFFKSIKNILTKSLSRQLMLGIASTHAILMTVFIFDMVTRQQEFLTEQSQVHAVELAETLAANSSSWLLANDFIGIEEIIASQADFSDLRYALFIDMDNRVLGYSDTTQVGKYLSDSLSQTLLTKPSKTQILLDNAKQIDIAAPIMANNQQIGWARISIDRSNISSNLALVTQKGFIYMILAIIVGIFFAWLSARGLSSLINKMIASAHLVKQGEREVSFELDRADELGELGHHFDQVVQALAKNEKKLTKYQGHLEQLVDERTTKLLSANKELELNSASILEKTHRLEQAYEQTQLLQEQLIESEKFAALGELVSGIAHEVNTPLGISYTGISFLRDKQETIIQCIESGRLSKKALNNYIDESTNMINVVTKNLERAIELIDSFKQISVAQSIEASRKFSLNNLLQDIVETFASNLQQKNIKLVYDLNEQITLNNDPSLFSQLLSQLINNSMIHGFSHHEQGAINIKVELTEAQLLINYHDDGHGMDEGQLKKLYAPFYTTKMGQGSNGLGMHIVYNIVTQRLNGTIKCTSEVEQGTCYQITLPTSAKDV